MLDGETAFKLYDTYGFPLDLTQDALRARGISRRHRRPSTRRWSGSAPRRARPGRARARRRPRRSGSRCARSVGATEFLGYETESAEGVVAALVKDGKEVDELKAGESGVVVVNQTPFYGESGGQVGDTGEMRARGRARSRVTDTQKKAGDLFVHHGQGRARAASRSATPLAARGRSRAPRARSAPTIRRRICCTRRCARCSAITWRRRARWSRPTGCASTSRTPSRSRAEELARGRGHRQRHRAAERAGDDAADGARRRASPPAPARCSARNTATRCASWRWASGSRQHAGLVGRAVRRHACQAHRRHRPDHGRRRERGVAAGVRRIEALTGRAARKAANEQIASASRRRRLN